MNAATSPFPEKAIKLADIIKDEDYQECLDSVMPGGVKFHKTKKNKCKEQCPEHKICVKSRNGTKVCSDYWKKAEINLDNLGIIFHVLNYFDHYNKGDLRWRCSSDKIAEFREFIHRKIIELIENNRDEVIYDDLTPPVNDSQNPSNAPKYD